MRRMRVILTRKAALKLAWQIFWFATGTARVGMIFNEEDNTIELLGTELIKEEW